MTATAGAPSAPPIQQRTPYNPYTQHRIQQRLHDLLLVTTLFRFGNTTPHPRHTHSDVPAKHPHRQYLAAYT